MADVDMELDISHPTGLDGHVDDDLIDYDDDDIEISGATWKTQGVLPEMEQDFLDEDEQMQMHGEPENSNPSTQTMPDKSLSGADDEILDEQQVIPDSDTVMSAAQIIELSTNGQDVIVASSHAEVHDIAKTPQAEGESDEVNERVAPSDQQNADENDEIDYEDDDGVENAPEPTLAGQELSEQANKGELGQNETNEPSVVNGDDRPASESGDGLVQSDLTEHDPAPDETAEDKDEHEITWEDNGAEAEDSAIDKNPNTVHTLSDQQDYEHPSQEAGESGQGGTSPDHHQESTEWDEEAHNGGGGDTEGASGAGDLTQHEDGQYENPQSDAYDDYADAEHDDHTLVDDKSLDQNDEVQYPAVTIVYKGEEYPLASASSDAFFSDPAVQDFSIQDLLAHFRDVLGEEVTPTEELMFKVDELGLEFSETSPLELITGNTLRGLLDIFDVLVRNQDPDTSRGLYAYLYAKPNATKRLEFLIESAANGIGLDEVIYLFDPSMVHHGSSTNHTVNGEEGHVGEEFEGDENEDQADYAANTDHGDNYGEPAGDYEEDGHDAENHVEEHSQQEAEGVDEPGEFSAAEDYDAAAEEPALPDIAVDLPNGSEPVEGGVEFDDDKIDFTLGSTATVDDDEVEDSLAHESVSAVKSIDATTTAGDELDFSLDQADVTALGPAPKDDDLLSEIDWRDPEAPDDEAQKEAIPTPPSATKRSRPEDEVDLDEQQDAKRLRS